MSDEYLAGETARLSISVFDAAEAPSDPAVLRLRVLAPEKSEQTYTYGGSGEVVKESTGLFHVDVALPMVGTWYYRWETEAPAAGVAEGSLVVRGSRFTVTP